MKPIKTLFVCEFITGGGLACEDLPSSLANEGVMMRDALLRDLSELADWRVVTTLDARLEGLMPNVTYIPIAQGQNPWDIWQTCMEDAQVIWVIAPETNRLLLKMAQMANNVSAKWLGAGLDAIAITTDKYQMAQLLTQFGLRAIPTYHFAEWTAVGYDVWLVKPIDGAGCEAIFLLEGEQAVLDWFNKDVSRKKSHIIQPYMTGIPASISVVNIHGQSKVLSCNLQNIALVDGQLFYRGGVVNGAANYWEALEDLAHQIVTAIPGLEGYFGVDILIGKEVPEEISIVEINPRLTTTYAYLHEASGCNVASMLFDGLVSKDVDRVPPIQKHRIEFNVEHAI